MGEIQPAECFHVGEFVQEELNARGWTTHDAASRLVGDYEQNVLWLELLCDDGLWQKYDVEFTEQEAVKLGHLFGSSEALWMRIHLAYVERTKKGGGDG